MSWQDGVTLGGLALAVGGAMVDVSPIVYACLAVAGVFGFTSLRNHRDIGEGKRILLFLILILGTPYFMYVRYGNDMEKELKSREGYFDTWAHSESA